MSYDDVDQHQHLSALFHACANRLSYDLRSCSLFTAFLTGQLALALWCSFLCPSLPQSLLLLLLYLFHSAVLVSVMINILPFVIRYISMDKQHIRTTLYHENSNTLCQLIRSGGRQSQWKNSAITVKTKSIVTVVTVVVARTLCYHMVPFWASWATLAIIVFYPVIKMGASVMKH